MLCVVASTTRVIPTVNKKIRQSLVNLSLFNHIVSSLQRALPFGCAISYNADTMPPPIPARSRSRQRLTQHQDAADALAHIRALQQETTSKNRQKDRALLVLENPKESQNQASVSSHFRPCSE